MLFNNVLFQSGQTVSYTYSHTGDNSIFVALLGHIITINNNFKHLFLSPDGNLKRHINNQHSLLFIVYVVTMQIIKSTI